jgi:hypothetical protein
MTHMVDNCGWVVARLGGLQAIAAAVLWDRIDRTAHLWRIGGGRLVAWRELPGSQQEFDRVWSEAP